MSAISLSELERVITTKIAGDMVRLSVQHNAIPVLLEIARAAANDVLRQALAKVTP